VITIEEFIVAMEWGYLQCERGNNIQQARINAKKLWEESGFHPEDLIGDPMEDPVACKYCDQEFFPKKDEIYCSEKCQQSDIG
jgi:hypothetical protein